MSSALKDARWEVVTLAAELNGKSFEDFSFEEWQGRLDEAQKWLEDNPQEIEFYAMEWRIRSC